MAERSFTERIEYQESMPPTVVQPPREYPEKRLFVISTIMGVISISLSVVAIAIVIAK
jgi:hypothetical protein